MKFNFFKKIWGRKKEPEEKPIETQEKVVDSEKEKTREISLASGVEFKILPLITEKSLLLSRQGKFTFLVDNYVNKIQIKEAIEKLFKVNVIDVKTMNYKKRIRGVTKIRSVRPRFKKAIVTLKQGQTIPIFE
jgi:large subunit ribosomal protein L23